MTPKEFSLKIKMKYPQYKDMDDNELTQKITAKYPQYKSQIDTDWKGIVGGAVKSSFKKPMAFAKDLGTNPVTMANAMPTALGTLGGVSPIPGGATMGTAAGQGLRDLSLKAMKKPIPGLMQHGLELGGAALGDIAAIPALKKSYYGGQIGEAERAAGVVTRAPTKAVTPGSVGETLNTLEAQLDSGTIKTAQEAKDAKAVISQIYKNPKIYEQTGEISVQAQRVSKKVQYLINQTIPGRVAPAQALGKAMAIPNAMKRGYQAVPWQVKLGVLGGGTEAVIRKLLGL